MGKSQIGIDQGQPVIIEYNDEFSHKDFTGWSWQDRHLPNDIVIYNSCFSNETPDAEVFKSDMTGVTFICCNLDNCLIPQGNIVIDGSRRRFKVQNDLRDWEIDSQNKPVEVINKKYWGMLGFSVDKADIPPQKLNSINEIKRIEIVPVLNEVEI